ncbi:hypothetical protein TNCV_1716631 [Trichonephila clavipes]|nr:hypothetical protein TNCV_1716631 [Trichonephila clavipes]
MSRFGGLSEERPSVFKTRSKLGTHLSTQCSEEDERQSRPCAAQDSLRLRAVGRVEAGKSQVKLDRFFQVTRKWLSGPRMKSKQMVLSAVRRTMIPQFVRYLAAVSGRKASRQTFNRRLAESVLHARYPVLCGPLTLSNMKRWILWS